LLKVHKNPLASEMDQLLLLWTILKTHLRRWSTSGHRTRLPVIEGLVKLQKHSSVSCRCFKGKYSVQCMLTIQV